MDQADRQEQFIELISAHRSRLFGYLLALVQNMADAEDLFQNTCLVLWKKFDTFAPGNLFVPWALRTAQLEAMNFLRTARRSRMRFGDALVQELAATELPQWDGASERQEALAGCLKKLPSRDRELVDLCYGRATTIKEAAAQLNRSTDGVYKSLNRIRLGLLHCIQRALAGRESR